MRTPNILCSAFGLVVSGLLLGLSSVAFSDPATFATFDAPSNTFGTQGPSQATIAESINEKGTTTGYYVDAFGNFHAFVRDKDGTFAVFDAAQGATFTAPVSINEEGTIAGIFTDNGSVTHGFVRERHGAVTTFEAFPVSINEEGTIAGSATDPTSFASVGFVRRKDGTLATFAILGTGTFPYSINGQGTIAGSYSDASFLNHGFVRDPDGTITMFDAPGAGTTPFLGGTGSSNQIVPVVSINDRGTVVGSYIDASGVSHGFVRDPHGTITTIDAAGAGTGPFQGTGGQAVVMSLNDRGTIAGSYTDAGGVSHGLVRDKHGTITTIDAPGAAASAFLGTFAQSVNRDGTITGYFFDEFGIAHGFVRGCCE
jgi:hypothetical protein